MFFRLCKYILVEYIIRVQKDECLEINKAFMMFLGTTFLINWRTFKCRLPETHIYQTRVIFMHYFEKSNICNFFMTFDKCQAVKCLILIKLSTVIKKEW